MEIGTPQQFRWLWGIIAGVLILNLADGVLTLHWYFSGGADEANPLMAVLISRHPVLFITAKTLLVALGILLLWRYRRKALAGMSEMAQGPATRAHRPAEQIRKAVLDAH